MPTKLAPESWTSPAVNRAVTATVPDVSSELALMARTVSAAPMICPPSIRATAAPEPEAEAAIPLDSDPVTRISPSFIKTVAVAVLAALEMTE